MKLKKIKLVRRFGEDIWGDVSVKWKKNKVSQYLQKLGEEMEDRSKKKSYIFRVDIAKPKRRKGRLSMYGNLLMMRRKVCLFYGSMRVKRLMNVLNQSVGKGGSFNNNVVNVLERQLMVVLYRMNFAYTMEEGRWMVRTGMVSVNKEVVTLPGFLVKEGDIVEIVDIFKGRVHEKLKERVSKGWFYTTIPQYIEVNYQILAGMLVERPKKDAVAYPFEIDEHLFKKLYDSRLN